MCVCIFEKVTGWLKQVIHSAIWIERCSPHQTEIMIIAMFIVPLTTKGDGGLAAVVMLTWMGPTICPVGINLGILHLKQQT